MATLSYFNSPSTKPKVYRSIADLLDTNADNDPDKVAHVFWTRCATDGDMRRRSLSFRQLADAGMKVASGLLALGLRPGDRLAIYGAASPEWMYLDTACLRIQILMVRLPPTIVQSANLGHFLHKHKCRVLVIDPQPDRNVFQKIVKRLNPEEGTLSKCEKLPGSSDGNLELIVSTTPVSGYDDVTVLADIIRLASDDPAPVKTIQNVIDPDNLAVVYATSGSTGVPKLVAMSHFNVANFYTGAPIMYMTDRLFSWMGSSCLSPSVLGMTMVYIESTFTAKQENMARLFTILEEEGVEVAGLSAYLVQEVMPALKAGTIQKPSKLRALSTAGEALPRWVRQDVLDNDLAHMVVYACTEVGLVSVDLALPGTKLPPACDNGTLPLSFTADTEAKVIGDDGKIVPLSKKGELCIRSPCTFREYLDDPESTKGTRTLSSWVKTGDMVTMCAGGKIVLHGRRVDIISKAGVKVYPATIEAVLKRHPRVASVYVTGVPDDKYGQEIGACVVAEIGCTVSADELLSFCEENLDSISGISLAPKYVLMLKKLPTLPTGKINRLKVKDMLAVMK